MSFKKFLKVLKANWILAWLITAVFVLVSIVCYAEYEEANTRMKRVFVASKPATALFTSNYLMKTPYHKDVCFEDGDTMAITVYLRNYNINDPNKLHEGGVSYYLTATLAHKTTSPYILDTNDPAALAAWADDDWCTGNYSIVISKGRDTMTLSGSNISDRLPAAETYHLSDSERDDDTFTVTFNNVPLDSDYCVTLTAVPTDTTETLTATIGVASVQEGEDNEGWTCTLADDSSADIGNYSAFNYTVIGSGGTSLEFSYDTSKLQISPVFLAFNNLTESTVSGDWKKITITVDPNVNSYDIQMYKVNSSSADWTSATWNKLDPKNEDTGWVKFRVVD